MENSRSNLPTPDFRKKRRGLQLIYLLFDAMALVLAGWVAMHLYLGQDWDTVPLDWYMWAFLFMSLTTFLFFYLYRLYDLRYRSLLPQIPRVFQGLSLSFLLFFTVNYFLRPVSFSRGVTVYFWVSASIFLAMARLLAHVTVQILYRRGVGVVTLLPVGEGEAFNSLVNHFRKHPQQGYLILDPEPETRQMLATAAVLDRESVKDAGEAEGLEDVPKRIHDLLQRMMEVYRPNAILLGIKDRRLLQAVVDYCETRYLDVFMIPDVVDVMSSPVEIGQINSVPLIRMKINVLEGFGGKVKRILDIAGASFGLLVLSPLFLILAVLIKMNSRGPVFFRHRRLGMGGRIIQVYKFRTMISNAEEVLQWLLQERPELREEFAREFKLKDDPRITRLGRFLRRTSLDELPQLINVLIGEMSLVGPRPIVPKELVKYGFYERLLLRVPPGLTGLWQANGRSEVSYEERVKLDMYYINNWSIWLDLLVILKTIPAVFARKGAY